MARRRGLNYNPTHFPRSVARYVSTPGSEIYLQPRSPARWIFVGELMNFPSVDWRAGS
jgi:hypothetical protein